MKTRAVLSSLALAPLSLLLFSNAMSQPAEECVVDYEATDFHAHIFNLRHLPIKGILVSRGVPRGLAGLIATLFEAATPSLADEDADMREDVESRALFTPPDFSPEETATELRSEIAELIGVDLGEARTSGGRVDLCGSESRENRTIRRLCRKPDEIDEYYRNNIQGGDLRDDSSAADLEIWLRDAAVLSVDEDERAAFRPEPTLDGMLDQTDLDLKVIGILVEVLSDSEPHPDADERASLDEIGAKIEGGLRLLRILMSREDRVVAALKRDYCGMQRYVAYMMDMEQGYALSRKARRNIPSIDYSNQLKVNSLLATEDPSIVYFGAHDPFRLDPDFGRAEAAMSAGAAGLKFYPPSGYRITDMKIPERPKASWCWLPFFQPEKCGLRKQWDSRYSRLKTNRYRDPWAATLCPEDNPRCVREMTDKEFFDQTNLAFVKRSVEKDWIIFSHHTPKGFESYKGYGVLFADPCYWGRLLQSNPELQQLKLVVGHSGGNGWSWQCEGDSQFCPDTDINLYEAYWKHAYNLCVTFDNVYCDMGYQDSVLTAKGRASLKRNLEQLAERQRMPDNPVSQQLMDGSLDFCRYNELAPARISIFDKLMYGSDWMMVAKEPDMKTMPEAFKEVFSGELEKYRKKFFAENADRLFGP